MRIIARINDNFHYAQTDINCAEEAEKPRKEPHQTDEQIPKQR